MEEGWYLMSTEDLEHELGRLRSPTRDDRPSNALKLSLEDALAYRNRGNLPDDRDRTLRLVIHVSDSDEEPISLKRLEYEPDYHEAPTWKREGSRPVNVVPIRSGPRADRGSVPWWEDPEIAPLEREWSDRGTVAGLPVPAGYRSFVYKTVVALRRAGKEVTADALADSISRWLPEREANEIRRALKARGPGSARPPHQS